MGRLPGKEQEERNPDAKSRALASIPGDLPTAFLPLARASRLFQLELFEDALSALGERLPDQALGETRLKEYTSELLGARLAQTAEQGSESKE